MGALFSQLAHGEDTVAVKLVHPPDREESIDDVPLRIRSVRGLDVVVQKTGLAVRLRHNMVLPKPGRFPTALTTESVDTTYVLSHSAAKTLMRKLQEALRNPLS